MGDTAPSFMIPVLALFFSNFVPESIFTSALAPVPWRVANGYQALLLGAILVYLPFGLNLLYKIKITGGKVNNTAPQQQAAKIEATHPAFARLRAAERNMQESFLVFAPAVLAALQAGVSKEVVCLYCTAWLIARLIFIVIYAIQFNEAIAALRSLIFGFSLIAVGKLFYAAAALA